MAMMLASLNAVALADPRSGTVLSQIELVNPSYISRPEHGQFAYCVNEDLSRPGTVQALRLNGDKLTLHGDPVSSGGEQPCHISLHPYAPFAMVANYGSGTVAVLPINTDGSLEAPSSVVQHRGSGPDARRQTGPHTHQILTDPSGRWVLVCDLGADQVVVYGLDERTGQLHRKSTTRFAPGQGVRHLAFSADGRTAYVACELSSELVKCRFNPRTGSLAVDTAISTVDDEYDLHNYPAAVLVSRDGSRVYVTNRGHDSIAVIDANICELIGTRPCGGEWPRDAAISRDGTHIYVANEHSDSVVPFTITSRVPQESDLPRIDFAGATCVVP